MRRIRFTLILAAPVCGSMAFGAQDRYTLSVANGLSFSEFRDYDTWKPVAPSQTDKGIKVIAANDVMLAAYKAGIPGEGRAFPDGSKIAKIEWSKQTNPVAQYPVEIPGVLKSVSFIVKDSRRFSDTSGWGYAQFAYDPTSDTFTPTVTSTGCGHTCHMAVASRDYIFTAYPPR